MSNYRNGITDTEEKTDAYYSDELSRAAVGRLFDADEEEEDGPPPIRSAFVSGFDRATSDRNPTKKRERVRKRPAEDLEDVELPLNMEDGDPREEPAVDRHRRKEHATTRLLHSSSPEDNYDERRERRERRRNPVPKPAVRANVLSERPVRGEGQATGRRPRIDRPERPDRPDHHFQPHDEDAQNPEENLDSFRRRFSGELVSPPRNPNRPSRTGRVSDVRTNRMRDDYRDTEVISPLRIILAGAAILIVVMFAFITVQMISFRGRYNEARETIDSHELDISGIRTEYQSRIGDLTAERNSAVHDRDEFERMLRDLGHDPRQPAPPPYDDGTRPGGMTETPETPTVPEQPALPTTHTIVSGDNLGRIANRHFGNSDPATIAHIQAVNNITNPNNIQIGDVLQITPMN